ncbi:MAG TPA: DUF480 domain-containing protein [Opitutaceae bacterium]|nr:DUF480 domain-containing protein [Opitutaceae bacterium]
MDEVIPPLTAPEARVLGALIEKAVTTPDYYPLSLGALTNACNQLSNRDPVVSFEESTVLRTIDSLREKRLATLFHGADNRVPKYKHSLTDVLLLTPAELALLCVLLLRGPQTLGELRSRTERLYKFVTLPEVEECLQALAARQPQPLVEKLPRQFGLKESRYSELLSGAADTQPGEAPATAAGVETGNLAAIRTENERIAKLEENRVENERFEKLERETASLRHEVAELKQQLAELKKQWE